MQDTVKAITAAGEDNPMSSKQNKIAVTCTYILYRCILDIVCITSLCASCCNCCSKIVSCMYLILNLSVRGGRFIVASYKRGIVPTCQPCLALARLLVFPGNTMTWW